MIRSQFDAFACGVAKLAGSSLTFAVVSVLVLAFVSIGYFVDYSDRWRLISDTISAYAPILLVLILQSTQNKDTDALQAKLDELIAADAGARNSMIAIEEHAGEDEIEHQRLDNGDMHGKEERRQERYVESPWKKKHYG